MPQWTFVRHGESEANRDGWFAGQIDAPLTALGIEQAEAAGAAMDSHQWPRAFTSDLQRAHQTALRILAGRSTPLTITPALRERGCGEWGGRPAQELIETGDIACFDTWDGRPPGGESLRDTAERALRYLAGVDDGRDALVVVHGALIRAVIGLVDGRPVDEIGAWKPRNTEIVERSLSVGTFARHLHALNTAQV